MPLRLITRLPNKFRYIHSHSPKPRSSFLRNFTLLSALSITTYTLGSVYPPDTITLLSPRPPSQLPPASSPEAHAQTVALENSLQNLPLLRELRAAGDAQQWYEARPYASIPPDRLAHSLTGGTLRGLGKLAVLPLVRAKKDESESVVFLHVGDRLCGHEGIVHGGLIATLFDEILARTAINNLPEKIGVTASLTVNYILPTRANQPMKFLVFRTKLVEQKGRRCTVKGTLESLDGALLAESTATYAMPRYASSLLNTEVIKQAMGIPEPSPSPDASR